MGPRSLLAVSRGEEWWSHKLAPLLAAAYATELFADRSAATDAGRLALLLVALAVGALYVSVLNDLTDTEDDRAAGKANRAADHPALARALLVSSIAGGVAVVVFVCGSSPLLLVAYIAAWLAFALYSLRPVRLKARGLAGCLADAVGAHIAPMLFAAALMLHARTVDRPWRWYAAVVVWALGMGLRGAILHQLGDRAADESSRVATLGRMRPVLARQVGVRIALPLEVVGLAAVLWLADAWPAALTLVPYAVFEWRRARVFGSRVVVARPAPPYRILLHTWYVAALPLALLAQLSWRRPADLVVLGAHTLLFVPALWVTADEVWKLMLRPLYSR